MKRLVAGGAAAAGLAWWLTVRGELVLDVGWGRTTRPLGGFHVDVVAPRETVFDVVAEPYLSRTPRAMAANLEVVERGSDMVLAAHRTPVRPGVVATTLETVRFTRPERVDFRLVRGPVPHVVEAFTFTETPDGTRLSYDGELGADLWALGRWWGETVGRTWDEAVRVTLRSVQVEAERRARAARDV